LTKRQTLVPHSTHLPFDISLPLEVFTILQPAILTSFLHLIQRATCLDDEPLDDLEALERLDLLERLEALGDLERLEALGDLERLTLGDLRDFGDLAMFIFNNKIFFFIFFFIHYFYFINYIYLIFDKIFAASISSSSMRKSIVTSSNRLLSIDFIIS